ncbi:acyltransferase [Gloeocapsa sp. PCC 73106]|uniref:acyltransferase family protein n=1 Tax=Gloeocapsa sp. PCC 73106 TaxID=102232 RepID=UPI0002ACB2FF|nr:acyltransferase [Gloeocapsa sp. PCC 73106]ELR99029.1 putative acyltransferase [Gloeocapsa sp. PCC 73106]
MMKSERDYGIDLIRSLSVLYIVSYWHLFNYTEAFRGYYNPVTHHLTRIILASFVFVSGYLIAGRKLDLNWKNIASFWQKRLVRIYPLYALALLLFYWFNIAQPDTLIRAGLLISMFFPPSPPTLWFITMIMLFYVLAPILLKSVENIGVYLGLNILLMSLFVLSGASWELYVFFPSFSLGILLRTKLDLLKKLQRKQVVLTIVFILLYWFNIINQSRGFIDISLHVIFLNLGAILFYFYSNQVMAKIRNKAIVGFFSYTSFAMYLFHRPVFTLTKNLFFPLGETEQVLYLLIVSLPLTVVISWSIQRLYDRLLQL